MIWLITGSNMSGKSTYLRTVGINVVLALMANQGYLTDGEARRWQDFPLPTTEPDGTKALKAIGDSCACESVKVSPMSIRIWMLKLACVWEFCSHLMDDDGSTW